LELGFALSTGENALKANKYIASAFEIASLKIARAGPQSLIAMAEFF
jgi:hypothetical protein